MQIPLLIGSSDLSDLYHYLKSLKPLLLILGMSFDEDYKNSPLLFPPVD